MDIIIAKSAGFCMGVRRAVNSVMDLANSKAHKNISVLGPLIHNRQVNEMLEQKNVKIALDVSEIHSGICVIRTHGISPKKRAEVESKCIRIFDATCPRVLAVQSIIQRHAKADYFIVIVGDRGHAEVEGLLGFTGERGLVIDAIEKIGDIPKSVNRVCVVAQTTQNHSEYKNIAGKLKKIYSDCVVFDTICDSTSERQKEVKEMASIVDALVIVGGKESANTMRLFEIAKATGVPAFHVETEKDIHPALFKKFKKIGVSAGASTPNVIVHKVAKTLEKIA